MTSWNNSYKIFLNIIRNIFTTNKKNKMINQHKRKSQIWNQSSEEQVEDIIIGRLKNNQFLNRTK